MLGRMFFLCGHLIICVATVYRSINYPLAYVVAQAMLVGKPWVEPFCRTRSTQCIEQPFIIQTLVIAYILKTGRVR